MPNPKRKVPNPSLVFIVLAIAFIALGFTGQRTFFFVGIAFLVIALVRRRRNPDARDD
ncbi:MAG: hypothetical protein ABR556_00380 [Pyrinomonadaceae bacterium]